MLRNCACHCPRSKFHTFRLPKPQFTWNSRMAIAWMSAVLSIYTIAYPAISKKIKYDFKLTIDINDIFTLKVDMPILTYIFFTFNWLTLTSEMHFVKFHPEVASCLLSRGKRKCAPLGMRLIWKYIRNYFLVYQLISHFLSYLQNYKEFKAKILDLQPEKYGLSFDIKKCTTSGWALGDENVIGIRAFKGPSHDSIFQFSLFSTLADIFAV